MKFQKCSFAAILILAVSLLPFSVSGLGPGQVTPDQKALVDLIKVDPSLAKQVTDQKVQEKMRQSLAQQIASDFSAMKFLFEAKDFCCLAKLLEKRGAAIATPGYKKMWGGASAEFWQSVWKEGMELNFIPLHIEVSGAIAPQPVPFCDLIDQGIPITEWKRNPVSYDAVAILIFEFHIVSKSSGTTSHNATGEGSGIYLHKTGCPWG